MLRVANANETITINVGGQLFTTRRSTLCRLPHSRLYMVVYDQTGCGAKYSCGPPNANANANANALGARNNFGHCGNAGGCLFFDRDPEIFKYILDYYRTGELHLPHSLCGPFIRKELIFWGIPEEDIEPCCLSLYMKYEEERKTKNMLFRDCFEDIEPMKHLVQISRGFKRWRYKSWLFLDFPTSSFAAKVWAVILLLLMAVSIITYSLATHPDFRVERHFSGRALRNESTGSAPKQCAQFVNISAKDKRDDKDYRYDCTIPLPGLVILDMVLNGIFSLEVLIKTLISPDRSRYLKSPTTVLEICISTSFWLQVLLTHVTTANDSGETLFLPIRTVIRISDDPESEENAIVQLLLAGCNMAQALRVFRIFKLSKISSGLRVLMLTVKKSITELVLLGFLLINGMFLFACLIYLAEYNVKDTFPSIPNALWWAIITITGVGYGDVFPKGGLGYFVGALCAISGCTVTGLAIPIIGHNFNTYYKYMRNYLKEGKYLRELRKERGAFDVDVHDRDRLAIMKRKLSRGRAPVLQRSVQVIGDRVGNDVTGAGVGSGALRQRKRPMRRSYTAGALLSPLDASVPNRTGGLQVPLTTELQDLGKVDADADADSWNVDPCRTPKHGNKIQANHCKPNEDDERSDTEESQVAPLANNVHFCVDETEVDQPLFRAEKRKALRKLMGNSFDRGIKRPIT